MTLTDQPTAVMEPGTVVDARPWRSGHELPVHRGIVFGQWTPEYHLVWFPVLGAPRHGSPAGMMLDSSSNRHAKNSTRAE